MNKLWRLLNTSGMNRYSFRESVTFSLGNNDVGHMAVSTDYTTKFPEKIFRLSSQRQNKLHFSTIDVTSTDKKSVAKTFGPNLLNIDIFPF